MSEEHFYEKIKSVLDEIAKARTDNKITFSEAVTVMGEAVDAGWHAWSALRDTDGHFGKLVEDVEEVYFEFIAPLDIVGIPNIVERAVDRVIGRMIRPALQGLRDLVD